MKDILTHPAFIWSVTGLIISLLILWIVSFFVASYFVYVCTLKRRKKDQWGRELPSEMEPTLIKMYNTGLAWGEENKAHKTDVHIVNKGLNLYGEYYDFGSERCAVILSGRTESLRYGYFFAIPYAKNGCNILVLDPRAHGLSDGEYNTVGFEESTDIIEWVKMLKERFGIVSVVFHGICIGAAGGVLALTSGNCPDIVDGIVTEGMFPNFGESVKNHMKERKKAIFPTYKLVDMWMKKYTSHSMEIGPIDFIDKLSVPLLMLHSKEDLYSTPEYAQKLYDKAGTSQKKLVWFDHGRHSMLRITDTERYDSSISEFLSQLPILTK
ncbi:MAG: alpha/beta hydrolase [Ruminococcaceae bacterium]|nr:alpha/beta hydrolase [Oscillospiraceae bacterium]